MVDIQNEMFFAQWKMKGNTLLIFLELNIGDGEQKICIRGFMNVERVRGIYTE